MRRKNIATQGPRTAPAYTPERITHLDDVEGLARTTEGFVVHEKGRGIVTVDYTTMSITWNNPLLLEMRGLAFDAQTGHIAARPLHKFFDWRERGVDANTAGPPPGPGQEARVTEKADGTLVFPAETIGGTIWCTRAGATTHASAAVRSAGEATLKAGAALMRPLEQGSEALTPCFEWTGGDPIVVHYREDPVLRLIALRERESGHYIKGVALKTAIDRAERDSGTAIDTAAGLRSPWLPPWWPEEASWKAVEQAVATAPGGSEGVVVGWPDGLRVKMKSAWYEILHGIHESPWHPRYQLVACIDGERDEVLARVRDPQVRSPLGALWDEVQEKLNATARKLNAVINRLQDVHGNDQKAFALGLKAQFSDPSLHAIAFKVRAAQSQGKRLDVPAMVRDNAARQARHERSRTQLLSPQGMLNGIRLLERETG